MQKYFRRIPDLAELSAAELTSLSSFARVLCLPRSRAIVRHDRQIDWHLYLLRGCIETRAPDRVIQDDLRPLEHFYPGCRSACTAQPSQVLAIDSGFLAFLKEKDRDVVFEAREVETWMRNFLQSAMLAAVPISTWSRILESLVPQPFAAGQRLIVAETRPDACFVLREGRALIHRGSRRLRMLMPGDFFGEDAMLMRSGRTADVTALEPGVAMRLDQRVLIGEIQTVLVRPDVGEQASSAIDLRHLPRAPHILSAGVREIARSLDPNLVYRVTGGSRALCEFVTFVLRSFGHSAYLDRRS